MKSKDGLFQFINDICHHFRNTFIFISLFPFNNNPSPFRIMNPLSIINRHNPSYYTFFFMIWVNFIYYLYRRNISYIFILCRNLTKPKIQYLYTIYHFSYYINPINIFYFYLSILFQPKPLLPYLWNILTIIYLPTYTTSNTTTYSPCLPPTSSLNLCSKNHQP